MVVVVVPVVLVVHGPSVRRRTTSDCTAQRHGAGGKSNRTHLNKKQEPKSECLRLVEHNCIMGRITSRTSGEHRSLRHHGE